MSAVAMPMPWSATENWIERSPACVTDSRMRVLDGAELDRRSLTRLSSICLTSRLSAHRPPVTPLVDTISWMSAHSILPDISVSTDRHTSSGESSDSFRRCTPDSIEEMSRMSLMMASRWLALSWMSLT